MFTLPDWLHSVKIRFYKNKYPEKHDAVMGIIKSSEKNIGYHIDLIEYDNQDALLLFKDVCRSYNMKVISNTLKKDTMYPFTVTKKSVKSESTDTSTNVMIMDDMDKPEEEPDFDREGYHEIDDDDDEEEEIIGNVIIDISNRYLSVEEKDEAKNMFSKFKKVHSILHEFGFKLRQMELKSQEEADSIQIDDYKKYLEKLAHQTIWTRPEDEIFDICQQVRNNNTIADQYFKLPPDQLKLFIKVLNKVLIKTIYIIDCHFELRTINIDGVSVIKEALSLLKKDGYQVSVISSPNYLCKVTGSDVDVIKTKLKNSLIKLHQYIESKMGGLTLKDSPITNNQSSEREMFQIM